MTPKLLSPEELAIRLSRIRDYGACRGDGAPIEEAVTALRAHIAALEADSAALLGRLRKADALFEWLTDNDSLSDDGRERTRVMRARTGTTLASAHPGTTLLSEHARALVRTRNEGLEMAATSEEHAAMAWEEMGDADEAKRCRARASNIRAMKETEQ